MPTLSKIEVFNSRHRFPHLASGPILFAMSTRLSYGDWMFESEDLSCRCRCSRWEYVSRDDVSMKPKRVYVLKDVKEKEEWMVLFSSHNHSQIVKTDNNTSMADSRKQWMTKDMMRYVMISGSAICQLSHYTLSLSRYSGLLPWQKKALFDETIIILVMRRKSQAVKGRKERKSFSRFFFSFLCCHISHQ